MSDFKEIYKDENMKISDKRLDMLDTTDEQRTVVMTIGEKEFGFEFVFGQLIHTWQRWKK